MSNWGTLYNGIVLRSGGGRSGTTDLLKVKLAAIEAIARHDAKHFFFNEQRFTIQTVASQATYDTTDGLPQGIVRWISRFLQVDPLQDTSGRYSISRKPIDVMDRSRAGVTYTAQPEIWGFFDQALEIYPGPDAVHDIHGKVVVKPGVPIGRNESGTWKFYKPWTTSFIAGNEMDDAYPDSGSGEANAWFTEPLAFSAISYFAEYLLWKNYWHGNKGEADSALETYLGFLAELEEVTVRLEEPRAIQPMNLGSLA